MNQAGAEVLYQQIDHSQAGFRELDETRAKFGIAAQDCVVGIETAHNLLIEFLWAQGYQQIYVLPPSAVKRSRGLFKQTNARTDQSDAWLIANLLRNDLHNFHPWYPDGELICNMRVLVKLILSLTKESQRITNQLRAVLLRYYPAALKVFKNLDARISLAFITAYPSPQAASELSFEEFKHFARENRYPRPKRLLECFLRLQADYPNTLPSAWIVYQDIATCLAGLLMHILDARSEALRQLQALFQQHPDYAVFASLPGAGDFLAPALLSKFGDDRRRFPSANVVQALAGTCPVTDSSGNSKRIYFRVACDHDFRHITQQWARSSLKSSDWACYYFNQVYARKGSKSLAFRCLANRWLAVLWRLWQDRVPYDPELHLQRQLARSKPLVAH
jgi:transposase